MNTTGPVYGLPVNNPLERAAKGVRTTTTNAGAVTRAMKKAGYSWTISGHQYDLLRGQHKTVFYFNVGSRAQRDFIELLDRLGYDFSVNFGVVEVVGKIAR